MKELKDLLNEMYESSKDKESFISISEALRRKISKGLLYKDITEEEFDIIRESILDPIQKERSKLIFDDKDIMKEDVKSWIKKKIEEWYKGLEIEFKMWDLCLYGSSTGYQYSETADIDLHIFTDLTADQIKGTGKLIKLGNIFDNDMNPVTLFLLTKDDKEILKNYENLYNIDSSTWLKKSDKASYEMPYAYVLELSEFFMNAFDLSLSQYERAKSEYKTYLEFKPENMEITEEEKKRAVDKALFDLRSAHDRLRLGKHVMQSFAKEGYEEGRDFQIHIMYNSAKDPRLSVNNSVYKMLERFGYKDKLGSAIKEAKELIPGDNDSIDNRSVE